MPENESTTLRAVLLMAYGGPTSLDEVEPFLKDVRGGRETPEALVEEVKARYREIGGGSPLLERSREQAAALEERLGREDDGGWQVFVGMRHWTPYIREAVGEIAAGGFETLVALCLTPQESRMSVGAYFRALDEALAEASSGGGPVGQGPPYELADAGPGGPVGQGPPCGSSGGGPVGQGPPYGSGSPRPDRPAQRPAASSSRALPDLVRVRSWHDHPGFVGAVAERVAEALERFPADEREEVQTIFTAHSLPERILREGDPYDRQVRETAAAVARAVAARTGRRFDRADAPAGDRGRWHVAYQSAGARPEPWLGPSLEEVMNRLVREGHRSLLAAPVGFVSDHVEVLFDLDVEAAARARGLRVRFERTGSLNASPAFIEALADVVLSAAAR